MMQLTILIHSLSFLFVLLASLPFFLPLLVDLFFDHLLAPTSFALLARPHILGGFLFLLLILVLLPLALFLFAAALFLFFQNLLFLWLLFDFFVFAIYENN